MKKKPVVPLRRKSFGGQTLGIIWRKRAFEPTKKKADEDDNINNNNTNRIDACTNLSIDVNVNNCGKRAKSNAKKSKHNPRRIGQDMRTTTSAIPIIDVSSIQTKIGWDDILCRPIYYRSQTNDVHDCDISTVSGQSVTEAAEDNGSIGLERETTGGSTNHDRHNDIDSCSLESNTSSSLSSKNNRVESAFQSFPVLTRTKSKTFASRDRRRPMSLMLNQEDDEEEKGCREWDTHARKVEAAAAAATIIDRKFRRVSMESTRVDIRTSKTKDHHTIVATNMSMTRNSSESSDSYVQNSTETIQRQLSNGGGEENLLLNPHQSLDKARDYFDQLDKTQPLLTLDSALSPTISSKVTRTIRKTNFASPGINKQYLAYSKSSLNAGVTPLSIKDFASMRKLNNGPIVDGFFDEE